MFGGGGVFLLVLQGGKTKTKNNVVVQGFPPMYGRDLSGGVRVVHEMQRLEKIFFLQKSIILN